MNTSPLTIRWECARPIEEDAKVAFLWRNDPITRSMSFHTEPQSWEDFLKTYLQRSFSVPSLPPLFAIHENRRVAFIFFEASNSLNQSSRKCCTLSINLDPEYRSKGLGTLVLKEVQNWVRERGYDTLLGEIKAENSPSLKAFEKAGFKQLEERKKKISGIEKPFHIFIYGVELTPFTKFPKDLYIIAEAGSNWKLGSCKSDLAMAKALIESAADAGANAVKFQVFRPETVYVPNAGQSDYLTEGGLVEDINSIFTELSMPYEMIPLLADHCKSNDIQFLASFFSEKDFEAIDPFVSVHKIASYENEHVRLLDKAAKSGKPMIISTGASTEDEIAWTVEYVKSRNAKEIVLLQCTACYPAKQTEMNLAAISRLKNRFHLPVGLSDHSADPLCAPIAAVALGAKVIEKHFTLHHKLPGPDHYFAVTPQELKEMIKAVRVVYEMIGNPVKEIYPSEEELRNYAKRGLQAIRNIKEGELLEEGVNVSILRPGKQVKGMHPKLLDQYIRKPFLKSIPLGQGIQTSDLQNGK